MIERRRIVIGHVAIYDYLHLLIRLGARGPQLLGECTRCGGNHPLSQCRWPA